MKENKYMKLWFLFFIYCLLNFIIFFKEGDFLYPVLCWNVLLSILPMIFIDRVDIDRFNSRDIILILLWLFFFPNSIYMITDFIHISGLEYSRIVGDSPYSRSIIYNREIIIWIRLLLIGLGLFFSTLLGLESLSVFYEKIRTRLSKYFSLVLLLSVSLLTAVGIYIGRFLRFNSWDILINPVNLLKTILDSFDIFALLFIIIFMIWTLFLFYLYTYVSNIRR